MAIETAPVTEAPEPARRVRAANPVYWELREFLDDEAELLDRDRLPDWLATLAPDVQYVMPVRVTRVRGDGDGFVEGMGHFDEDRVSLGLRVKRLTDTTSAWAEDPPSRVRRFVTNVKVHETEVPDEFAVTSYILMVRSRWDLARYDLVSAERQDVVRRTPEGWRLARRRILVDQSTLGTPNLAVFL